MSIPQLIYSIARSLDIFLQMAVEVIPCSISILMVEGIKTIALEQSIISLNGSTTVYAIASL